MKKFIISCSLSLLFFQAFSQDGFIVKAKLTNLRDYVPFLTYVKDGQYFIETSPTVENGMLVFTGRVDGPVISYLGMRRKGALDGSKDSGYIPGPPLEFALTNEQILIEADADELYKGKVTDNALNRELNEAKSFTNKIGEEHWLKSKKAREAALKGDSSLMREQGRTAMSDFQQTNDFKLNYIKSHPQTLASMSYLSTLMNNIPFEELKADFEKMGPKYKQTFYGKSIAAKIRGEESTLAGKTAIEINKVDMTGKTISLAGLRGKYVLIDFWGSWCHPCRASHPHLKELYAKYKPSGFEIVGIAQEQRSSLDENRTAWKDAIKKDGIDWIQILNNEGIAQKDAVQAYGVTVFPTKVLLDKEGKVVSRMTGDSNEIAEQLSKVFGF
jgi:thiol-disulfide isomerase/thioredoxin